jgi:hypothetical protein
MISELSEVLGQIEAGIMVCDIIDRNERRAAETRQGIYDDTCLL